MNRRLLGILALTLLGAAGCKRQGSLWLLLFEPNTTPTECEDPALTHNFNGASEPSEEDTGFEPPLLTVTQELTQSDAAVIAEVTGGSEPVLVIGSTLWTGEKDGSTTTFKWTAEETSTTTQSGIGYNYVVDYVIRIVESMKLDFKGNEASGNYKTTQESNQSWSESDTWNVKDVGVFGGQIPAYNYLEVEGPGGNPIPAHNTAETTECAAANCELAIVSSCEMSVKVTATELVTGENDETLDDASRPPGVGWWDDDSGWLE